MLRKRAAVIAALFMSNVPIWADPVTLVANGGGLTVMGDVLGYDGKFIRVDTEFGELTLDFEEVTCTGDDCPDPDQFVPALSFAGAHRIGDLLLPSLVEAYARQSGLSFLRTESGASQFSYVLADAVTEQEKLRLTFRLSNTDEGFADLLANEADVVMAVREVRPTERNLARDIGLGDLTDTGRSRIVALDGLVPIVSPGQTVKSIALADLDRAFSGEISNWSELGGRDAPINLYLRDVNSGLAQGFEDRVLGPSDASLSSGATRLDNDQALSDAVFSDSNALGVTAFESIGDAEPLGLTGPCGLTVTADRTRLRTEDYPLTIPLFLYLPQRRLPDAAMAFLNYVRSPEAQRVVRRAGFVDQAGVPTAIKGQGDRLATAILNAGEEVPLTELQRMMRVLGKLERLSTTFRFEVGSTRLDAQSRSNAARMARDLRAGVHRDQRLIFVGFSDARGPASENRKLSSARAEAVLRRVNVALGETELSDFTLETEAFGEALPMACDDTEWGRQVNRRVEVWVGPRLE